MSATTTLRTAVEQEIARVFSWECDVHDSHDGREDRVYLGECYDRTGNSGSGVAHFRLDRLAEILPTLPDYGPTLRNDEGAEYVDTAAAWAAIEAARVADDE